jgi:hypothetical protein
MVITANVIPAFAKIFERPWSKMDGRSAAGLDGVGAAFVVVVVGKFRDLHQPPPPRLVKIVFFTTDDRPNDRVHIILPLLATKRTNYKPSRGSDNYLHSPNV